MVVESKRFSRNSRLTSPSDFQKVFDSNTRSADSCFVVLARTNGLDVPRLGFAISARRVRLAVTRNLVKRVVRESFRLHQDRLCGLDIVVLVQKPILKADRRLLRASIEGHWKKIARCKSSLSQS